MYYIHYPTFIIFGGAAEVLKEKKMNEASSDMTDHS
jgi:hypothetical protein